MSTTVAFDFGSRNVGVALVEHTGKFPNRVFYAATIIVDAKWLTESVGQRVVTRRMRRTRKTHKRRLRRLAQALHGIEGADRIVRFCRRRGYSHDPEDTDEASRVFHIPRARFFDSLQGQIEQVVPADDRERVLQACAKHLNRERRRDAELRPARFENRGPSKCQWEGCRHNVPRAGNDIKGRLQQALYGWLKPVFDESANPDAFRRSVAHWIGELVALGAVYRKSEGLDQEPGKEVTRNADKRKRKVFRNLRDRVAREAPAEVAEQFAENWRTTYSRNLTDIVKGKSGGRVRYCREHSDKFVDYFLAGEVIPNKKEIADADLISRKQQIVFSKLWRLVEGRLLPLAGGRIDRVIVERVAFDVLAGPLKNRQKLPEDQAAEMYWRGPQRDFSSRREMFRAEFDGRCAYCGQQGAAHEVEHLLPRSRFPFDSYLNLLPACSACNAAKGPRTASEARMKVHQDAYEAYERYVAGLRVPHVFHTIKKGMLKLLARDGSTGDVERKLGMLANNLVNITATQRGPRPLARYLAGKLDERTGHRPEAAYVAGRHTALYRSILLPDYEKPGEGDVDDHVNHAIDAIILGCELPSAAAFENPRWHARAHDLLRWREKVREASPELLNGIPQVQPVSFVEHFEQDIGDGYCLIQMSAFNWNRSRKATHKLDPVGMTSAGLPMNRIPAADVLNNLTTANKAETQIDAIAHRGLRQHLESNPSNAARLFVEWLQRTTRRGLADGGMGNHPSDIARRQLLEEFINRPADEVVAGELEIPRTIGVRCLNRGAPRVFDVTRSDRSGRVFQHYSSNPSIRELFVGYRTRNGQVDRSRPVVFYVNQVYEVTKNQGGRRVPIDTSADSPLHGRPMGSSEPIRGFLSRWNEAFATLCQEEGIVEKFRITQGVVIEKTTGECFQIRNFRRPEPWMKGSPFRNIRRIHRSPLRFLAKQ
ncbi:HNH endonuclease [Planctomycetota bacterium]